MAKVSLRIYDREIESLIDQGHLDEAIAHCHHILQTFPKHLETYRLLGKSYLEAKRYDEAVDIFSRVLMAVPDDFVSHVGMSIIRDEGGKLDEAIWHMERAFESQPSNAAIQNELQRLYGRRDGVAPPKIRMTRGALAHMYVQGELYPQAISEIRSVLSQDPQRADMQILLARAFFRGGQKADASDMCAQLLKRYVYCFDANRIMVELIPASDRAENTQVYRHRVNELDPYAAFARESVFRADEVPDASVNLERLEYTGQAVELAQDWGSSLAIGRGSEPRVPDEPPEWLKAGLIESREEPSVLQKADEEASLQELASGLDARSTAKDESDIPDFLRAAGWTESSGAKEESAQFGSSPEEELAPADIPDWLKSQMPAEPVQEPTPPAPSADLPDWLSGLGSSPSAEAPAGTSSEIPDWLNELDRERAVPPSMEPGSGLDAELLPDRLQAEAVPEEEPAQEEEQFAEPATLETLGTTAKEQDDAVAWLEMLAAKHGAKPEELVTDPNARTETPPEWVEQAKSLAGLQTSGSELDQTGIWLSGLGEEEPPAGETEEPTVSALEVPDWLSGLESRAAPETSEEGQPARAEVPDWLSELTEEPAEEAPGQAASVQPDWPGAMQAGAAAPEAEESAPEGRAAAERIGEMEQEQPEQEVPSGPATGPVTEKGAEVPDWLRDFAAESAEGTEPRAEEIPAEPVALPPLEEEESFEQVLPSQLPEPQAAAAEDLPEWLRGVDESKSEPMEQAEFMPAPEVEELAAATAAEDLPEWLRGVDESKMDMPEEEEFTQLQPQTEEPVSAPSTEELPDWLRSVDAGGPETEASASPAALESGEWTRTGDEAQPEEVTAEQFAPPAPSLSEAEQPVAAHEGAADLPEWLRSIDETQSEEADEGEGLPAWLKSDFEADALPPSPVSAMDWHPAEPEPAAAPGAFEPAAPPAESEQPVPDVRRAAPPSTERPVKPARARPVSETAQVASAALGQAKVELSRGDIPAAMDHYNRLIRRGKHLEETIRDLRESLYRYPVEVNIWQTLGDAYLRANRLQEALDAYNKAEELLR